MKDKLIDKKLEEIISVSKFRDEEISRLIDSIRKVAAKICKAAEESWLHIGIERDKIALRLEVIEEEAPKSLIGETMLAVYVLPNGTSQHSDHIWNSSEAEKYVIKVGSEEPENFFSLALYRPIPQHVLVEIPSLLIDLIESLADEAKQLSKKTSTALALVENLAKAME